MSDLYFPLRCRHLLTQLSIGLSMVLKVGEKWASENNKQVDDLVEARLVEDMNVRWLLSLVECNPDDSSHSHSSSKSKVLPIRRRPY